MKIVQILPELNEGGVERGTLELSRELVKLGHESVVISHGGKLVTQLEREGALHVKLDVCSKNPLSAPCRILKLYWNLKTLRPDILHARSRVPAWMVFFANAFLRIPFVTTVHGLNSVSPYSKIMTKGDQVICVSEIVQDYILKHYQPEPTKLTVIQRGVDLAHFNPEYLDNTFIETFKTQFAMHTKFVITSVGRITWLKDYETFIEAIAIARRTYPDIVGVIVGGIREDKTNYFQSLKDLALQFDVAEHIVFTGSQTHMPEIYALSNVVVNASLKMGNVARTVTEALAMNTPVIATTYEGLNNVIVDDVNGYIIKTKDPEDLAAKIIRAHQQSFANIREKLNPEFTLDALVQSTIGVYEKLIHEKRKPS
jgi:glycosyltransferase involved in cell wall biosynthesis